MGSKCKYTRSGIVIAVAMLLSVGVFGQNYHFDGTISRAVLEHYLDRSISMEGLLNGRGDLDDNIRMLDHTGAKFIGRSICLWGGEGKLLANFERARVEVPKVLASDPDRILEACIFEIVTPQVDSVPVPGWAFKAMGLKVEKRNFRYKDMLYVDGRHVGQWGRGGSVPDVSRMETRLWFYFLAASYIDLGFEAIHYGQVELMNHNDPDLNYWSQVFAMARAYGKKRARRHILLCDAHTPGGGFVKDGKLLLDFHAFPLRIMEIADAPATGSAQPAKLQLGFSDGLYRRSKGGLTASGWSCDHLPYLVEFDNYGVSKGPGQAGEGHGGFDWIWGYDEISWFAHQPLQYRKDWLSYAWKWVRDVDSNAHLEMPGSRTETSPLDGQRWYHANNPNPATPDGLGDEEAIREIWLEQRVTDLLSRMNVEEKIRQLDMYWGKEVANMGGHEASSWSEEKTAASLGTTGVGSVHDLYPLTAEITNKIQRYAVEKTRLGIPVLFIEEGLHGYSGLGSTSFPIPLQIAAAWDTTLTYAIGRAIATETRAHGVDMLLGPVLCLPRDPRWGRVEETYGEDTYLDARMGVAMVKGFQGQGVDRPDAVVAEPKHFAVHGIPEAGSNTAPVNIGEREARSSFLYVFEKAVREGGALSMMAAYSELDGIPCVDNGWLLTDVLRKEWGFKGFVLSDLGAIKMSLENHHIASDIPDALSQTLKAGLNMQFYDFPHPDFLTAMKTALANGQLSMEQLDRAVRDVLRVKFMVGLFDHPYTDLSLKSAVFHTPAHQDLALKAAQESIVLLKNEGGLLPLRKGLGSLAVVGPLAVSTYLGGYSNTEGKAVSILDGLKQRAGASLSIRYEKGYSTDSVGGDLLPAALDAVRGADATIVVLGEESAVVGEGKDRAHLQLSDQQMQLVKAVYATGKPVIVLLCNGRPICFNWVAEHIPAIVDTWFSGEKGGLAVADILLGNVNPSGKLPMTFPRSEGQIPFYYNHKPTSGHRYVDEASTPLYPFGHGLSYTRFDYSDLKIVPATIGIGQMAEVQVTVTNSGSVEGTEVAQLYLRDVVSSVTTPGLSLKGFGRVELRPGESRVVHFTLGPDQLALWNREMQHVVEPGEFKVMVGSSSADIRLTDSLWVR